MNQTKTSSLAVLISVFFFWGFVAASNTILIPLFKKHFLLLQWQSQLVDSAFYAAYAIGAIIYFLISFTIGDPLNKIGYKKGLIYGLTISAIGALGFVPAATLQSFGLMLASLFVVGLGFALQQIVANPYIIALGAPATGAHRACLAQGINSFGTTIGPLILSYALFGNISGEASAAMGLDAVKLPYVILSGAFLLFAGILGVSQLPPITTDEHTERTIGALKYPQLLMGMLAIFAYVGTEVTIQSNMPALMERPEILGLDHTQTAHFISLFWGSLMIGRWTGAITVFNLSKTTKRILSVIVPLLAYAVIIGVNYLKGSPVKDLLFYFPFVLILIAGFMAAQEKPARTLMLFGTLAAVMMLIGLASHGKMALYSFISGGLFCSVMWPCIFALSIAGLGKYTNQASSLLIMMILGGALIPPLQGYVADYTNIHLSYFIPMIGFAYLAFFGWRVKNILNSQGIDYDSPAAAKH